jgi:LacI family transcriptional regulator
MKNLNIKDIAKLAGVGVSTVSRVINQHHDVKEETRKHVLEVIEKYNYIPNNSARNLKRSDSMDIGILIKGMYNPLFARIVEIMEKQLTYSDYSVVIHYNNDGQRDIDTANEFVLEKKLCGLICLGGDFDEVQDEDVIRLGVPLVLTSTQIPTEVDQALFSSASIDNEDAAARAVYFLHDLGHRNIGLITTGVDDKSVGTIRTAGYLRALEERGLPKKENYFEVGAYTFETGYEAMQRLLKKAPDLTAVFAISDMMAIGAAKAAMDAGLRIPGDLSIMGFDDIDYAAFYHPTLTTMHQPVDEMAQSTAEMIVDILDDHAANRHEVFSTELKKRASTRIFEG